MIYPCIGTVAWRAGRPFTRIGRAKRVGRPALQATEFLTEESHVAASSNAKLCKKTIRAQLRGGQIISHFGRTLRYGHFGDQFVLSEY